MWVYFVQQGAEGPIKIGFSSNILLRMERLQTANSEELRLLLRLPGSQVEEHGLHRKFLLSRIRGEWYRPTPDLLAFIQNPPQDLAKALFGTFKKRFHLFFGDAYEEPVERYVRGGMPEVRIEVRARYRELPSRGFLVRERLLRYAWVEAPPGERLYEFDAMLRRKWLNSTLPKL
jgi:hypothetical protein